MSYRLVSTRIHEVHIRIKIDALEILQTSFTKHLVINIFQLSLRIPIRNFQIMLLIIGCSAIHPWLGKGLREGYRRS